MRLPPIKLERKLHPWGCLATSFAMAFGVPTEHFYLGVGHNGSRIIFPHLPEPQGRRATHVSEACHFAIVFGFTATPFELIPQIAPLDGRGGNEAVYYGDVYSDTWNWEIFQTLIRERRGVIECQNASGTYHAVAFERNTIFDPDGSQFIYSREACESRHLFTHRLWLIEKR